MIIKDRVLINVEDMLEDGRAFGRADGLAVFVSGGCVAKDGSEYVGAVPGDVVMAEITKIKKNSAEAVLKTITEPSSDRMVAGCPYFGECGGCTLQELSYNAQLRLKKKQVKAKLERLGGLQVPKVNEPVGAETLKYYRNKATFAVGPHGEVGFMKGKSHFVMDIEDCMLQSDAAMVCADALRTFLKGCRDEVCTSEERRREEGAASDNGRKDAAQASENGRSSTGKNRSRIAVKAPLGITQMIVRTAFGTGEVMVVLESERKEIPGIELLIAMLDDAVYSINAKNADAEAASIEFADLADNDKEENDSDSDSVFYTLESVALVYGADPKKVQFGKCTIVAGKPTITDEFVMYDGGAVQYEISPQSFFQVNPEQMSKLYDKVAEYTGLLSCEGSMSDKNTGENPDADAQKPITILDLYCGAGTIGIWLLKKLQGRIAEKPYEADVEVIESSVSESGGAYEGRENVFDRVKVIGIESVKPAVIDANRNSVINGLVGTRYICGKAEDELSGMMGVAKLYKWNEVNERVEREPEIIIRKQDSTANFTGEGGTDAAHIKVGGKKSEINSAQTKAEDEKNEAGYAQIKAMDEKGEVNSTQLVIDKVDVAILDPPRAGCGEALLAAVAAVQPGRIVYVSCDPGTLARDIKYLTAHGYDFIDATPIDMFPWTSNVETVVLLSREWK